MFNGCDGGHNKEGTRVNEKKETYERPLAEIVEFASVDGIATSLDHGPNVSCSEAVSE